MLWLSSLAQSETIRQKLFKIGAVVRDAVRRIIFSFAEKRPTTTRAASSGTRSLTAAVAG